MEKSMPTKQETDRELREEFTDALFCLLAGKALDRETRHFMEETEPPTETEVKAFSGTLDRLYTRYSRQKFFKTAYNVLSKVSVVIVVVICAFSVTVINVAAIREPLLDWVFQHRATDTIISFPDAEGKAELPEEVSFEYLPDGFTEISVKGNNKARGYTVNPKGTKEQYISFSMHQLTGRIYIDTEDAIVSYKDMGNGQIAMVIVKDYLDGNHVEGITWHDNNLLYILDSNAVSEEELFRVMESIKVK